MKGELLKHQSATTSHPAIDPSTSASTTNEDIDSADEFSMSSGDEMHALGLIRIDCEVLKSTI